MRQILTRIFWRNLLHAWQATPGVHDADRALESAVYGVHLYGVDLGNVTQELFNRERPRHTP